MAVQKKNIPLYILEILKQFSDEEHRFSQKEMIDKLKREYDIEVDRKTIRRNIETLLDCGYNINYKVTVRKMPQKDGSMRESEVLSDFYLEREFSQSELKLLMDGLLFSGHIPNKQKKDLLKKLENLSSSYFTSRMQYVHTIQPKEDTNKQLFYTIDVLEEAIRLKKQVQFQYCHYSTDKKLHPMLKNGQPKWYVINPYQLVATSGHYYLICNYDKYDNLSNFRLDRIKDITILETPIKPIESLKDMKNGFDLQTYMNEELYMFSGRKIPVTFTAKRFLLDDIMGAFGGTVAFLKEDENEVEAHVLVNEEAMLRWALQYASYVKIESPLSLKNAVKDELKKTLQMYET